MTRLKGTGLPPCCNASLSEATPAQIAASLDHPHLVSAQQLAALMGATADFVEQLYSQGRINGLCGDRRLKFPTWQIGPGGNPYGAISKIIKAFNGDHWTAWQFLEGQVGELGEIGYRALARGRSRDLLRVIEARAGGSFS